MPPRKTDNNRRFRRLTVRILVDADRWVETVVHEIEQRAPKPGSPYRAFNAAVADFLAAVDAGRWEPRDPRSVAGGILGFDRK